MRVSSVVAFALMIAGLAVLIYRGFIFATEPVAIAVQVAAVLLMLYARITFGRMRQPAPVIAPFERADELLAALGGVESRLPVELYDNGVPHVYVALGSKAEVAALQPDFAAIAPLGDVGINCFAGEGASWKTRMFGIGLGMVEDPATGSAAGPLALHLARHGVVDYGTELEIVQGEEIKRRSVLYATAHSPERIEVGGTAVIVARGEFQL